MKVAFITRSTLHEIPGGDTIQVVETAKQLEKLGVQVDILLSGRKIDYSQYHLFHFFNITRPADILFHIARITQPFVLSPILIDYSEYDRFHRKGFSGLILKSFSSSTNEYIKALSRWIAGKEMMRSKSYLWKGQVNSIREILSKAAMLLPNSESEYLRLAETYHVNTEKAIIPNGVDPELFEPGAKREKDKHLILCAARIEGLKNQVNLIKALNNTKYTLLLVGSFAPNQERYFNECQKIAAGNIQFHERVSQEKLIGFYRKAKVHVLPSFFETCGLSTLEAAAMGCNIVITDRGYTRDYFGDHAFYCDPNDPGSIFTAIEQAAEAGPDIDLQMQVRKDYTWQRAAMLTLDTYKKIISN